jgi:FlaA1/EpsC-like NDP-sugar epimerase
MSVETQRLTSQLRLPLQRTVDLVPSIPVRHRLNWQVRYVVSVVLLDALAFAFAGAVAIFSRFGNADVRFEGVVPYWVVILLTTPLWIGMVVLSGGYNLHVLGRGTTEYKRILDASLRLCATVGVIAFGFHLVVSRSIVLIGLPLCCLTAVALRTVARKVLARQWSHGRALQRVLVIGRDIERRLFPHESPIGRVIKLSGHTFTIVGVLGERGTAFGQSQDDIAVLPITRFFEDLGSANRTINIASQSSSQLDYNRTFDRGVGLKEAAAI